MHTVKHVTLKPFVLYNKHCIMQIRKYYSILKYIWSLSFWQGIPNEDSCYIKEEVYFYASDFCIV